MQIRQEFLDYFVKNSHKAVSSSPLVPHDASLLFTNSGMVQFKDCFLGNASAPSEKVATVQKCVRAGGKHNDLENVGHTNRHHTFFEMLGNFSFGGYFKEEAISLAWNFLTKELGLNKDRLYVTVYHTDDDAYNVWKKIINESRIVRIGTNDNFWQMGDVGPCGPCSEIFYDYGDSMPGGLPGTAEQDGPRYTEIWNIVFMQNEKFTDGRLADLPRKCIDTGMGLERITSVIEGQTDNYETSLFAGLKSCIKDVTKIDGKVPCNIIADHIRSSSFLIADGVIPSNEGRGYVLRRIIRRMLKTAYMSGFSGKFLAAISANLESTMGSHYGELIRAKGLISEQLSLEEDRFFDLFPQGMKIVNEELKNIGSAKIFSGAKAFRLYDTFGFPLDLTEDILKSKGVVVDVESFNEQMNIQKERSRASWSGSGDSLKRADVEKIASNFKTKFVGYEHLEIEASVSYSDGGVVILDSTPFYAESGGQVSDGGTIGDAEVLDVQKYGEAFVHFVNGSVPLGKAFAKVDADLRQKTAANHTAAHLLHYALKKVLGESVAQKGSFVDANKVRFDFSYSKPLSNLELEKIESIVNAAIIANNDVGVSVCKKDEAIGMGAVALFGEKYGDEVRVIAAGESTELCGGTHTGKTGNIGLFKIVSEGSIASGIRRIEAVSGLAALGFIHSVFADYNAAVSASSARALELRDRISQFISDVKSKNTEIAGLHSKIAASADVLKSAGGVSIVVLESSLANLTQVAKSKVNESDCNVLVINKMVGKFMIAIASSDKQALEILKKLQGFASIKAGGSPDFVSGGGVEININDVVSGL